MYLCQFTVIYLILSIVNQKRPIFVNAVPLVLINLAITEIFISYAIDYNDSLRTNSNTNLLIEIIINIINIFNIFILQDVYTYFIHLLFHRNKFLYKYVHSTHHVLYDAFYTFHSNPVDHILMNIFSLAVPAYLAPVNKYVLETIICYQIYSAINGHTEDSETQRHQEHHINPKKKLGSLYLVEYIIDRFEKMGLQVAGAKIKPDKIANVDSVDSVASVASK